MANDLRLLSRDVTFQEEVKSLWPAADEGHCEAKPSADRGVAAHIAVCRRPAGHVGPHVYYRDGIPRCYWIVSSTD